MSQSKILPFQTVYGLAGGHTLTHIENMLVLQWHDCDFGKRISLLAGMVREGLTLKRLGLSEQGDLTGRQATCRASLLRLVLSLDADAT